MVTTVRLTDNNDIFDHIASSATEDYLIYGLNGDDFITGNNRNDTIIGNSGNDTLIGDNGNDNLFGGMGNDILHTSSSAYGAIDSSTVESVFAGAGNDTIWGGFSTADLSTPSAPIKNFNISGGNGGDAIMLNVPGTEAIFNVHGDNGHDLISAIGGITSLLNGDEGNDTISATSGNFTLRGGAGDDFLTIGHATSGSPTNGFLAGEVGNDVITGNATRDSFTMTGGIGNDLLQAYGDFSRINEVFSGGVGNDTIISVGGNDTLTGGDNNDLMRGGAGADNFIFTPRQLISGNTPFTDIITDFEAGIDKITFISLGVTMNSFSISTVPEGTVMHYVDNANVENTILLSGIYVDTLQPGDFISTNIVWSA
jgi:Ca2+-binding RTX toxin-like protein